MEDGGAPGAQAMQDALLVLEGKALFDSPELPVYVRVAGHGENIYLGTGASDWSVIEITPAGWSVISAAEAPVRFRRPRGMAAHPV